MKALLLLLTFTILYSCNDKPGETAAAQQELPVGNRQLHKPISPNLASAEILIKHLGAENTEQLMDSRPFLTVKAYTDFVNARMTDQEKVSRLYAEVFLPLNLNEATEEEILAIPGVGKKMAHEFEEYRPYQSMEQFRREIGKYVDQETVTEYEKYVYLPKNLNLATEGEILTIPGVGKKIAHEFEEYRPYQNIQHFRREIGKYVDDKELNRLSRYVTL